MRKRLFFLLLLGAGTASAAEQGQWSGNIALELRAFIESPAYPLQQSSSLAFSFQPEYYHSWDNGDQSFLFVPFLRADNRDPERSHADIRELSWTKVSTDWELRLGIRKVYWGVTESQHLVDIINQTDLVENIDGEDKLGQAMLNLAWIQDWGTVDFFLLPGFRERTFPGPKGRLRTALVVDTDQAQYESSRETKHIDAAVRWSHSSGDWDWGLSHFYGTSRDPQLLPGLNAAGAPILIPRYSIIQQTGLALQATKGDWLLKLEAIRRESEEDTYTAATSGFEYTLVGLADSSHDLGLLFEYSFDDRGEGAPTPFEDDIFLGARWVFNDTQSTEILAGVFFDRQQEGSLYNIEASRRLGNAWKLSAEMRLWQDHPPVDPLYSFREDDHLLLELARYF